MANLDTYFLFLVAIIAGWLFGRVNLFGRKPKKTVNGNLFEDYFVGLNYLLNDEPDEAIDTFINALEINSETIETHLALGALLRRRGKVDKAINVHQALLARPGLSKEFSDSTRLQLSLNYIAAGLLDRAERLSNELLVENSPAKWAALEQLITIYQTEKEWEKAIEASEALLRNPANKKDDRKKGAAAHYCCELAEQQLQANQQNKAREQIKRAFGFDRHSIRAALLLARLEQLSGNQKAAIKELSKIIGSHPEFIPQTLPLLHGCYKESKSSEDYEKKLEKILGACQDITVALAYAEQLKHNHNDDKAIQFLNSFLESRSSISGVLELLQLYMPGFDDKVSQKFDSLKTQLEELILNTAAFRCNHCGYELKTPHWMCPSCKNWDRVKPITEGNGH